MDYGWRWFSFHAAQRMTVFNFYLVAVAIIFVGFHETVKSSDYILSLSFAGAQLVIAVLFKRLDRRTSELVKIGESLLEYCERDLVSVTPTAALTKLAENKDSRTKLWILNKGLYSYTQIFQTLYNLVALLSLLAVTYSVVKLLA